MEPPLAGQYFAAPWGRSCKVSTVFAAIILFGAAWLVTALPSPPFAKLLINVIVVLTTLICALLIVRGYQVVPGAVLVQRLLWKTRIGLETLRDVRVDPDATRRSLRLCGNGGYFAFVGWFWNRELGNYRMLATDLRRSVVLDVTTRRWVLSPDDPPRFVEAVRQAALPAVAVLLQANRSGA